MNANLEIFLGNQWVAAASLQAYGDDRCRMEYLAPYIFGDQPAPLSLTMPVEFGREPMLADGSLDRRPPPFLYDLVPQGRGRQLLVNLLARADSDDLVLPLLMAGAFNPIGRLRISSAVTFYQNHIAKHAPSVPLDGFTLGDMQVAEKDSGVWAPDHHDLYLWQAVQRLRSEGVRVVQALPGQDVGAAREAGCDRQLQLRDGRWQLAPLAS